MRPRMRDLVVLNHNQPSQQTQYSTPIENRMDVRAVFFLLWGVCGLED